jgi:hypothetical protein
MVTTATSSSESENSKSKTRRDFDGVIALTSFILITVIIDPATPRIVVSFLDMISRKYLEHFPKNEPECCSQKKDG